MIRILIADDHPFIRGGIKLTLAGIPDIDVTGEAAGGDELLARLNEGEYDLLLLDVNMPGRDGLDLIKQIKIEYPNLPVLMLTMMPEDQYAMRFLKAGASGYVTKDALPERLVKAIRIAHSGGKYVSDNLAEKLVLGLVDNSGQTPHETLSDREYQILCLIASGKTPTQIAEHLSLSVKTVSTYRSRIMLKMKMSTNAELTHYALKSGLVD